MKYTTFLLLLLALTCTFPTVRAQERTALYTAHLQMPDPATGAKITVNNDSEVLDGLRNAERKSTINGYRICIFFDNTQNGRSLAAGALGTFRTRFPGIPGEVTYSSPTFKTNVAYCMDMTEASILLGRIRDVFPKAVIVRTTIPVSALRNSSIGITADSTAVIEDAPPVEELE